MASRGNVGRKSVDEILTDNKLISVENLALARKESAKLDRPLQQVVVDMKFCDKVDVLQALSREWRNRAVDLAEMEIDPDVVRIIPEQTARRHHALPFAKEDSVLLVAMADPRDFFVSEDIHLRTGFEVQGYLAMPEDILREIDKVYGITGSNQAQELLKSVQESQAKDIELGDTSGVEKLVEKADVTDVDASAPEVEKIVNAIILSALQQKSSDIHIEPFEDPAGKNSKLVVRFRVDGFLREANFQVPWYFRNAVIAKVKIMTSSMNITERRIPQRVPRRNDPDGVRRVLRHADLGPESRPGGHPQAGFPRRHSRPAAGPFAGGRRQEELRAGAALRPHRFRKIDDALRRLEPHQPAGHQDPHRREPRRVQPGRDRAGAGEPGPETGRG